MAIQLKHSKTVAKADGVDNTVVQPSDWNATHTLTAAAGKVLGTVVGSTTVSELPISVDSSGNVGIGTSSTAEKFHIRSSGSVYAKIQCDNAAAGVGWWFTNTTTNWLIGAGPVSGGGEFAFHDSTRSVERMRIDTSGNVGIGTSSVSARLHVDSAAGDEVIRANSTGATYLSLYRSNVREAYLQSAATYTTLWVDGAKPLFFGTGGSERLRITAAGGVSFGSSGTAYGTSGQVLTSNGDTAPTWNNLPVFTLTTANVLSATAGANAGDVGTYAFLRFVSLTTASIGTTHSGSGLRYSNANGGGSGTTTSGTWRLMGETSAGGTAPTNAASASLFLRIA